MNMILNSISIFAFLIRFVIAKDIYGRNYSCELYLAPSFIKGAGRGVFAGVDFYKEQAVTIEQSLTMKYDIVKDTQLNFYTYNTEDEINAMALFGASMLFNHHNPKNMVSKCFDGEL